MISGEKNFFERKYIVKSYFNDTAGLLPGAYVRLSGVRIGTVTDIYFPESEKANVIDVKMEVSREGVERISTDSKATIRTEGLLGAKYIEIVRGETPPPDEPKDEIRIESYTPPELQEIIGQSEEFLTNIISISESLDKIVKVFGDEENLNNIHFTMRSLRSSSESLQRNLAAIEKQKGMMNTLIYDEKFANDLEGSVSNLNRLTAKLGSDDGVISELEATSENLREITDMLKGGEGTLGALLIDPSVYDSLKGVLGEAERSRFIRTAVKYMVEKSREENE
jgi:phospholipid/cholesterol/gamma-HCH transport system substrate-binding protein